jgi:RNA recognition motif-containing protein
LSELIDEAIIFEAFSIFGALKTVRLSKTPQGVSLKLATVEFHTEQEAEAAYAASSAGLSIHDQPVVVKRARDALRSNGNSSPSTKVTGRGRGRAPAQDAHSNGAMNGYVWDEKTKYWYHTVSGYYFDPETKGYYNSATQQWYTMDASGNYIPLGDSSTDVAAGVATRAADRYVPGRNQSTSSRTDQSVLLLGLTVI